MLHRDGEVFVSTSKNILSSVSEAVHAVRGHLSSGNILLTDPELEPPLFVSMNQTHFTATVGLQIYLLEILYDLHWTTYYLRLAICKGYIYFFILQFVKPIL